MNTTQAESRVERLRKIRARLVAFVALEADDAADGIYVEVCVESAIEQLGFAIDRMNKTKQRRTRPAV